METIANNELVIDVNSSEIAIALLQDKQLIELSKEKSNKQFTVGDIYLGTVRRIMAGLNAAFVDVGYEKDAFLHYLDLGPQYLSLHKFLQIALTQREVPKLSDFENKLDIDKNGKITDILKPGQPVLVQIAKEPISTKGPRISSELSIAGRYLVLMPFSDKVSISTKIKSAEERNRLKNLIMSIKPKNFGVIVRTVAEGKRVAVLDTELRELVEKWENAMKSIKGMKPPGVVIDELSRTSAILRDILNPTFNNIYVNNSSVYSEVKDYIKNISPEKQKIVKYYSGRTPIFEYFGIDKQIKSLFGKIVTIKNGAYLIIEHTEALHVIDVNSGNRSKKDNDQETNALEVNISAADEIARQLRLRDMGGIIVIDFIDMHNLENKIKLYERMKEAMAQDRTKHSILPLSKFGLMQITRQRVRQEMNIKTMETCPTCGGSGEITPSILFVDELESHIKYIIENMSYTWLTLKVHPYIAAYLTKNIISIRLKWWFKYKLNIKVIGIPSFSFLEYHFFDKTDEEIIL